MFFNTVDPAQLPPGRPLATKADFFSPVLEISVAPGAATAPRPFEGRFSVGDRYKLSLDSGVVTSVSVTALAAGIGMNTNDSYMGVIALVPPGVVRYFTRNIYAVSRIDSEETASTSRSAMLDTSVDAALRRRITDTVQSAMRRVQPAATSGWTLNHVVVQPFRLADGALRYHAVGVWGGPKRDDVAMFVAWLDDTFAIQKSNCSCPLREAFPETIVNVVTLGPDRTGIIVHDFAPGFFTGFTLFEYQETNGIPKWVLLQTLGAGG
jgi:hypothetical protein